MSQQLSPLRDTLRDKLAELEPRLADLDARLKGLGATPAKDAPPEDAGIATERARLTQQRAEIDAAIKQVQLLQTRAAQLVEALFGSSPHRLCRNGCSSARPMCSIRFFWRDVLAAMPTTRRASSSSRATGELCVGQRRPRAAGLGGARDCGVAGICDRVGALVAADCADLPRRRALRQSARRPAVFLRRAATDPAWRRRWC